jgi:hypothetical protein
LTFQYLYDAGTISLRDFPLFVDLELFATDMEDISFVTGAIVRRERAENDEIARIKSFLLAGSKSDIQ